MNCAQNDISPCKLDQMMYQLWVQDSNGMQSYTPSPSRARAIISRRILQCTGTFSITRVKVLGGWGGAQTEEPFFLGPNFMGLNLNDLNESNFKINVSLTERRNMVTEGKHCCYIARYYVRK